MALVALAATACGAPGSPDDPGSSGGGNAAASTTLPDGSVPWLSQPLTPESLQVGRSASPSVPADAAWCRAPDLAAHLPKWFRQTSGGGIYGWVELVNRGGACQLRGEASAEVVVGDLPTVETSSGPVGDEGEVVGMPPGGGARVRIDWTPPSCALANGAQVIVLELTHGGGSIRAPVERPSRPDCLTGESAEDLRAHLLVGPFEPLRTLPEPSPSPLKVLQPRLALPAASRSGEVLHFQVTLENPSADAIELSPCPAYVIGLNKLEEPASPGVNELFAHRLNCAPRPSIGPGEAVVFRMEAELPKTLGPGTLDLVWRLLTGTSDVRAQGSVAMVGK